MGGFVKIFSDVVDSSIWEEDAETCKVWVTLLALSDADGFVRGSIGWLAGKSKVTIEKCAEAVTKFQQPDPRSRTPDNEGRRIEQLADGWLILNYLMFRERLSTDSKAVSTRERVKRHRQKHSERYAALRNASSVTSAVSASASVPASVPPTVQTPTNPPNHPETTPEPKGYHKDARTVLYMLNEATGRHFRETDANLKAISYRLKEPGVDLDGVKQMIKRQCQRWKGSRMEEYLRPETLFGKTKFDSYYASKDLPIHENDEATRPRGDERNFGTGVDTSANGERTAALIAAKSGGQTSMPL